MGKIAFFFMSVAILVASSAFALELENLSLIDLDGRYWFTKIGTKVTVGALATTFNEGTVGIKDENNWEARGAITFAKDHVVRVSYIKFDYKGSNNLNVNLNFGGKTYNAGTAVTSSMDMDYLRLGWIYNIVNKDHVKFGTLLEVKGLFSQFTLADATQAHKYEFNLYAPAIGAVLNYTPHKMFGFFAEASGMYAGKYGYLLDTEAGVKLAPHKYLQLQGGYRLFDIKGKSNNDKVDLKFYGPFVGLTLHF